MKSVILAFFMIFFTILSCSKKEENTIVLKTSGQLKVQVINKQNQPFDNIKVKLFDYSLNDIIKYSYTDKDGIVDFEEINANNYSIIVDTPKINNIKFYPQENVQIVSGVNKLLKIVVDDYVGSIFFCIYRMGIIKDYYKIKPFVGLNILLINIENYAPLATLDDYKLRASMNITTDSAGLITARNIPSGITYEVIAYKANESVYQHIYDFSLKKGDKITTTIYLDSATLYRILPPNYK